MEVKLVGIDIDNIGQPRNDGTRGSALYRVPLKLSSGTSRLWAELFQEVWDHPPAYTTRHRPGIARVVGNSIVLDGTTVEEVRDVHISTLKSVISEVNRRTTEAEAQQAAERERVEEELRVHDENVRKVASQIKFDD